ncbi:MAG: hypothetical protein OXI45_00190 [Acidobacteriota bacterium]|nr:hypothetical protein [Acidobacteriota bacterium]MXW70568.1 hypothetical protein [Acidobacteriota bacterium]MXX86746.1 hypothetical protein [Acidobacteriota bacterium]MYE44389.1 hypothetical protein [Acidobacteriota bacterium]MYF77654.1 hypothetical protein [Acidobacteriota bacterium]
MFNNPFDSFHNTVAEAKEEREQLDRLLTVSTPRERLLVGAIALLLLGLTAWFLLGDVGRSLSVDGVLVEPGRNLSAGRRSVQALVRLDPGVAPHIKAGMAAAIELRLADGEAETLDGELSTISAVPLSEGLAALQSVSALSVYRVDIELEESLALAPRAGGECRILIELGRQTPISILRLRRS